MLPIKLLHVICGKSVGVFLDVPFICHFLLNAGGSLMSAFLLSLALRRATDYALDFSTFDFMWFKVGAAFIFCSGLSRRQEVEMTFLFFLGRLKTFFQRAYSLQIRLEVTNV